MWHDARRRSRDCLRLRRGGIVVPIVEAAAARAKPSIWLACRRVWRNVARQSKSGSRVAAPIVMIPTLDVESILRTWTPDSPRDIPLKGAQAASRQPSQPSQPTRPAFAGLSGERVRRGAIFTRVRSARVMHACHLSSLVFRSFFLRGIRRL